MTDVPARSNDRAPHDLRPTTIAPHFVKPAAGLGADHAGRDARDLHGVGAGERPALDGRAGPRLGHRRVRDASGVDGDRKARDISKGRLDGRSVEIQRLIGRSIRGVIDFAALGERTIYLDCDVLTADGGTRCASITGAYVALDLAIRKLIADGLLERSPLTGSVAAISCGIVDGVPLLDLDYSEDSTAEVDANVVMTGEGGLIEVQATAERTPLSRAHLDDLLALAGAGIEQLRARAGAGRGVRLILATRNAHKLREFEALMTPHEIVALPDDVVLPPETAETFAGNALGKARAAAQATRLPAIADDSGIEAAALGGAPGVRSARYAGEAATDEQNLDKLLREAPAGSPLAYVCALAYIDRDGREQVVEGRCTGTLAAQPRGSGGFGYDPAFVPDDIADGRTMAELQPDEKDAISHRGRAVRALLAQLDA